MSAYVEDITSQLQVRSVDHPVIDEAFEILRKYVRFADQPGLKMVAEWLDRALVYNLPITKRREALMVIQSFETWSKKRPSHDELKRAALLGWISELIFVSISMLDDIMDKSPLRGGRPTWYREVGDIAVNDGCTLYAMVAQLVKQEIRPYSSCHMEILDLITEAYMKAVIGQCLDLLVERNSTYTMDTFRDMALHKSGPLMFWLPVRLGMYLADISDTTLHSQAMEICNEFAAVHQIQDDYFDVYGERTKIEKTGTDIIQGKATWLLNRALELASAEQKERILSNIGKGELGGPEESAVKRVFEELGMRKVFAEVEAKRLTDIKKRLEVMSAQDASINLGIFKLILNRTYRREMWNEQR